MIIQVFLRVELSYSLTLFLKFFSSFYLFQNVWWSRSHYLRLNILFLLGGSKVFFFSFYCQVLLFLSLLRALAFLGLQPQSSSFCQTVSPLRFITKTKTYITGFNTHLWANQLHIFPFALHFNTILCKTKICSNFILHFVLPLLIELSLFFLLLQ